MTGRRGSEAQFQQQVLDVASLYGWTLQYHTHDSRRSAAGFPDLVLVRAPELIFAELKAEKGRIAPAQAEWIKGLVNVAARNPFIDVYVWQPADFDYIIARLSRGRPAPEAVAA